MKFFASAGAGDIEEALAFGSFASGVDAGDPLVEFGRLFSLAGDGGEQDMGGFVVGRCGIEFDPGEETAAVAAGDAFERGDEDNVPLEAFGFVHGEEIDCAGMNCRGGVELREAAFEGGKVEGVGFDFELVEKLKVAAGVGEFGFGEVGVSAKRAPGAFYGLGKRKTAHGGSSCFEDGPDAFESEEGVAVEQVATVGEHLQDGALSEGWVVRTGDGVKIGQ